MEHSRTFKNILEQSTHNMPWWMMEFLRVLQIIRSVHWTMYVEHSRTFQNILEHSRKSRILTTCPGEWWSSCESCRSSDPSTGRWRWPWRRPCDTWTRAPCVGRTSATQPATHIMPINGKTRPLMAEWHADQPVNQQLDTPIDGCMTCWSMCQSMVRHAHWWVHPMLINLSINS